MMFNNTELRYFNSESFYKDNYNLNEIEINKNISRLLKKARENAKRDSCYVCGNKCTSFCNSHSVPAFSLKNIAKDGELNYSNTLIDFPFLKKYKGLNNSGTFHLICPGCDSKIFQEYEDPLNYLELPSDRMIAQIAMKNYLKNISKRLLEIELYNLYYKECNFPTFLYQEQQKINKLDLAEFEKGYRRAKKTIEKNWEKEYFLFFHLRLDYIIPVAAQEAVVLLSDFESNIINNIYNHNNSYKMQHIHICIFPLENSSVIMMFIDSKDKRYRKFYKQFNKLTLDDKLASINYIIFNYCEDVYFSKQINDDVLHNENLINASKKTGIAMMDSPHNNPLPEAKDAFDLKKRHEIPNLLNFKYALKSKR